MRDQEIIEAILSSPVLPPTLASEFVKALPTLSTERVAWIVCILQQANEADKRYTGAAAHVLELLEINAASAEKEAAQVAEPVLADIMAEFESEMEMLMK